MHLAHTAMRSVVGEGKESTIESTGQEEGWIHHREIPMASRGLAVAMGDTLGEEDMVDMVMISAEEYQVESGAVENNLQDQLEEADTATELMEEGVAEEEGGKWLMMVRCITHLAFQAKELWHQGLDWNGSLAGGKKAFIAHVCFCLTIGTTRSYTLHCRPVCKVGGHRIFSREAL